MNATLSAHEIPRGLEEENFLVAKDGRIAYTARQSGMLSITVCKGVRALCQHLELRVAGGGGEPAELHVHGVGSDRQMLG